eukprot:112537-Amphidinium_carterae.1
MNTDTQCSSVCLYFPAVQKTSNKKFNYRLSWGSVCRAAQVPGLFDDLPANAGRAFGSDCASCAMLPAACGVARRVITRHICHEVTEQSQSRNP